MILTVLRSMHTLKMSDIKTAAHPEGLKNIRHPHWTVSCDQPGWLPGSGTTEANAMDSFVRANLGRMGFVRVDTTDEIKGEFYKVLTDLGRERMRQ